MTITAGDSYELAADADVVIIAAGVAQTPGQSCMDLLEENVLLFTILYHLLLLIIKPARYLS